MSAPTLPADAGTLYERADALAFLNRCIAEATEAGEIEDGVLPDYLAELVADAETDLKTKVERTGLAALRREQTVDAIDAEIKRLQARKQATQREAERIKRYAQLCLEIAGETKIVGTLCTVRLQANPPSVRGDVPADALEGLFHAGAPFVRRVPESFTLDKRAVLERYKNGGALPDGLTVERSTSLRIA